MKRKYILLSAFIFIILVAIVYLIFFSKPIIKVKEINVTTLHDRGVECGSSDDEMIETVWTIYEDAKDMNDHQQIWQGDIPSNGNIEDYIIISYKLDAVNISGFDSYCKYLLINNLDDSKNFIITEWPDVAYCKLKRFSKLDDDSFLLEILAYKKGLSNEEIERLIHSVQIQVSLSNKIHKNYSVNVNTSKADIKYFF